MNKTAKQLERYGKGIANHHRIRILELIQQKPELSVEEIAEELAVNYKTIAVHTQKLVQAGLVNKKYKGNMVTQVLSPYGEMFYRFLNSIK